MNNNIKKYRLLKDLTQEQLAAKTDCTRQTIIAIEKNKYLPSLELAFKLAFVLEVSLEALFDYQRKDR